MIILKRYFWLAYLLLVTVAAVMAADVAKGYVTLRLSAPAVQPPARAAGAAAPAVKRTASADYARHCGTQPVQRQPAVGRRAAGGRGGTR